jgi:hypothetical protein
MNPPGPRSPGPDRSWRRLSHAEALLTVRRTHHHAPPGLGPVPTVVDGRSDQGPQARIYGLAELYNLVTCPTCFKRYRLRATICPSSAPMIDRLDLLG